MVTYRDSCDSSWELIGIYGVFVFLIMVINQLDMIFWDVWKWGEQKNMFLCLESKVLNF